MPVLCMLAVAAFLSWLYARRRKNGSSHGVDQYRKPRTVPRARPQARPLHGTADYDPCDDVLSRKAPPSSTVPPTYRPLAEYLESQAVDRVTCTFTEIESVLGRPLPPSARKYRPWWGNDGRGQAKAWMDVGWKTGPVDVEGETATFTRARPAG
jgi:hypothetical protein